MQIEISKPIFIFGCPNSGTTILWWTIKQHKDICGPDVELQDVNDLPPVLRHSLGKTRFRMWAHPKYKLCYYASEQDYNKEEANKIKKVLSQFVEPGKRLIGKSPEDTLRARLLQKIFPDAYFIAIVRNGYAVVEGIIRKRKDDPERPQFKGYFTTLAEAAEQWFRSNVMVVSNAKFLKRYKIIRYEDLVDYPAATFDGILDFLELDKVNFQFPEFDKHRNQEQIEKLVGYCGEQVGDITAIAGPMLIHFEYDLLYKELDLLKW